MIAEVGSDASDSDSQDQDMNGQSSGAEEEEEEAWGGLSGQNPPKSRENGDSHNAKAPPTALELKSIRDATDLYRSSSFKLQVCPTPSDYLTSCVVLELIFGFAVDRRTPP